MNAADLAALARSAEVLARLGLTDLAARLSATHDTLKATGAVVERSRPPVPAPTPGERLRQARRNLELSSDEIGVMVGLKGVSVRAHETGQNAISAAQATKYAEAIGCPPEWIMFGTQPAYPANEFGDVSDLIGE